MVSRKILLTVCGMAVVFVIGWGIVQVAIQHQAIEVGDLEQMLYDGQEVDGRTLIIQGDAVFDLQPDNYPNGLYLIDTQTPNDRRDTAYGYWFGIAIADLTCTVHDKTVICQPFDPSHATAFEFTGTVHSAQAGKRRVMWLSNLDFEKSRQFMNGKWQPLSLGQFELPMKIEP
jgi:hypothetical protein